MKKDIYHTWEKSESKESTCHVCGQLNKFCDGHRDGGKDYARYDRQAHSILTEVGYGI